MAKKELIWLSSPHQSGREIKYIKEALANNLLLPKGPNLDGFEEDIRKVMVPKNRDRSSASSRVHVSCVSSGTAAIHLALIGLGVEQGDEVICSSFTFSASANPIVYQKATPVFVDSEVETWNMNPDLLEEAIKDRVKKGKRPKAIIVVHLYGMPAKMDEIMEVANRYEIPVIEDAAEAFGSSYDGKPCGSIGEIGILSFNGNKIITTSGGGALVSNKSKYTELAKFLGTQARDPFPHYEHSHIGYNYRMNNISAGIGRGQMEVFEERVINRRENYFFYNEALQDISGISMLEEPDIRFYSNYWLSTILVDPMLTDGLTREDIRLKHLQMEIESRPLWKPLHLQPVFRECPAFIDGTSEELFDLGLCIPSSSNITYEERQFVVDSIRDLSK